MINRTRPFKLTPRKKKALEQYLKGEITQSEAAKLLRLPARTYIYRMTDALLRNMVRTEKLDISVLLNHY